MNHSDGDTAAYSKCWCVWRRGEGARGREHVRLVWVDAEGDPEEGKQTTEKNRRKLRGGGRLPNTEGLFEEKDKGMGKEGGQRGMYTVHHGRWEINC